MAGRSCKITKPLESQSHPFGEVRDWSGCRLDVIHDYVRHLIVLVEEVQDLGNAWCALVELCALGDVLLHLNLRVQRLVAVKFDEVSLDDHAPSVSIVPLVIMLVFCASADDSGLKGG